MLLCWKLQNVVQDLLLKNTNTFIAHTDYVTGPWGDNTHLWVRQRTLTLDRGFTKPRGIVGYRRTEQIIAQGTGAPGLPLIPACIEQTKAPFHISLRTDEWLLSSHTTHSGLCTERDAQPSWARQKRSTERTDWHRRTVRLMGGWRSFKTWTRS